MGSVDFFSLPDDFRLRLPKYPVHVARIARLAVDVKMHWQGWGKFLLIDALHHIQNAAALVAAFRVVVDAKDEKAKSFYMKFGFRAFIDNDLSLILSLTPIQNLFTPM